MARKPPIEFEPEETPTAPPVKPAPPAKIQLTDLQKACAAIEILRGQKFTEAYVFTQRKDGDVMHIVSVDGRKYRYNLTTGEFV